MQDLLISKFSKVNWDSSFPLQGGAYRSLVCTGGRVDPVIARSAKVANIENIAQFLPPELVLFVDPGW
jgi:hypothetical protein